MQVHARAEGRRHDDGRICLLDHRRTRDAVAGPQPIALVDRTVDEAAAALEMHLAPRLERRLRARAAALQRTGLWPVGAADAGDAQVDELHRFVAVAVAVELFVRGVERLA